ncbi:MAG TPA: universal stress protein [Candidatus Limnocylindrales bacterium]|nr:universal stress protein [Candidatus Limnocylindrales bacterium]
MKVLIAYDGSPGAEQALALAGAVRWPAKSTLRMVTVMDPTFLYIGRPPGGLNAPEIDETIMAADEELVATAADTLRSGDRIVEGVVLRGRPGTVLVDEAARFGADLAMGGSRGHGPISSLLLGSVSAEVVDHAPCPVLIARTQAISNVVLAVDGSAPAAAAGSLIATWPIFEGVPTRVVSVADVVEPWHTGIAPTMYRQVIEAHARDLAEARTEHTRIADEAAAELRAAGREASVEVRAGDAASEIIATAEAVGADLIVMGSRGQTGLARVLVGSVARNVLQGSRASVLIVHGPGREG